MQSDFSFTLNFQISQIQEARDVLLFSVIAQKSLTYLNLEGSERILERRFIFTEESCRKVIEPRRNLLYKYHLDLPKGLENNLRCNDHENNSSHADHDDNYEDNYWAFYLKEIKVDEKVYNYGLEYSILDAIVFADDKIEKLKQYLNTMKMLKFEKSRVEVTNFLYDHILEILHPNCNDSNLVMKCVTMFDFFAWVFNRENTSILKFVLHHAREIRQDLWGLCRGEQDPINGCIYHLTYGNIETLIKYGAPLNFKHGTYSRTFRLNYPEQRYMNYVAQKAKTAERLFLLFQLYYVYIHSPKALKSLRYIWRSIPEPYFSHEEIVSAFDGVIPKDEANTIARRYISILHEESPLVMKVIPRTLQHLCRVTIRNRLNCNFLLPYGVYQLPMSDTLKSYLNIEF